LLRYPGRGGLDGRPAIARAVAKASLNFVCAALGTDVARLAAFDALRDFVGAGSGDGFVRLLFGDEAQQAATNPGFVSRTGMHTMMFCGLTDPAVVSISLYGRPFAVVRVSPTRVPVATTVGLFDYKSGTHQVFNAERQPLEFLKLFGIAPVGI
jgi:hypothetical protein